MPIDLVGPDGKTYELDNEDPAALNDALAQGFKQPLNTQEVEPQGLGEKAMQLGADATDIAGTAAVGGLSGLTGGLFDVALGKNSINRPATDVVEKSKEANPAAYGIGEFAGMVASPLNAVGGGATKAVGATTRLGRIAAEALGGSVTGTLFGAGKTMSEAALGNTELTAEKLMAGAGLGGVLGFGGGGLGGVLTEGASAALPAVKALAGKAQTVLDDIANDATIKATRAQQGVLNRIGPDRLDDVAKVMRERGHIQMTPEKIGESVRADREVLGARLGKFLDDAEAAGSRPEYSKIMRRLDDFETGLNPLERKAIAGELSSAREAVTELGTRPANASGKQGSGFRALDDLKQTIQAKAKFSAGPVPLDDVSFGLRRKLAGHFRDELDSQLLPQLGSEGAKAFTESKAIYGALKDAERMATSGEGRTGGIGLKDLLVGTMGAGAHPMGMAAALGSKVLREQGPAIIARIADKLSSQPALEAMAQSFAKSLPEVVPKLGPYGSVLAQQAQRSPAHALAAHMAYAQMDPSYAATAQLAGLSPEAPDEHGAAMGRAQDVATVAGKMQEHDEQLERHLDQVFRGTAAPKASTVLKSQDFGAKRMRRSDSDAHQRRVDEIRHLATNPEALIERISANAGRLGQYAPAVTAAMTARANAAVQYLAKAAEVPPKAGPLAPEWMPTEAERFAFANKLETVQDPMSVFRHAAAGTLTEDQVEAFHAVYPTLARQAADKALERVAANPKSVPYRSRVMLGLLTGVDMDGTMSPAAIAANQQAIHATPEQDSPGAPPSSGSPKRDMNLAARTALPSQRREMEAE